MNFNYPIIVAGCPRSGTSLVTGVFHACGAWVGDYGAFPDNKKGSFENLRILSMLGRRYRRGLDPDPDINEILKTQGYKQNTLWVLKLTGPTLIDWGHELIKTFDFSHWVIVRRDESVLLREMAKRGDEFARIELYMNTLDAICDSPDIETHELHVDKAVQDPGGFEYLVNKFGLKWNPKKVKDFIDPSMWSAPSNHGTLNIKIKEETDAK